VAASIDDMKKEIEKLRERGTRLRGELGAKKALLGERLERLRACGVENREDAVEIKAGMEKKVNALREELAAKIEKVKEALAQ
jgi:hypothetical protein